MEHKRDAIDKGNNLIMTYRNMGLDIEDAELAAIIATQEVMTALHKTSKLYCLYYRTLKFLDS